MCLSEAAGLIAVEIVEALFPEPARVPQTAPRGPLDWHRREAEKMAAEAGEAVLLFPDGCPGDFCEGPSLPCLILEKDAPRNERAVKSARERIAPPGEAE